MSFILLKGFAFNPKASPELLTPAQRKGLLPGNEAQTAQEKGIK